HRVVQSLSKLMLKMHISTLLSKKTKLFTCNSHLSTAAFLPCHLNSKNCPTPNSPASLNAHYMELNRARIIGTKKSMQPSQASVTQLAKPMLLSSTKLTATATQLLLLPPMTSPSLATLPKLPHLSKGKSAN
ncbi:hypothetical protein C0993_003281, partial [Termitomyces sp. T159_Od127]